MADNKKGALGFKINTPLERFLNGVVVENPTIVLMIGMCPSLAITTSAMNAIYMGLATTVVLAFSNLVISLVRKIVPDTVRIPLFIVIIATFVTIVDMVMNAYMEAMYATLGVYIPLIVVNCIIFGRAEAYASKNGMIPAFFDGIGMGIGFTIAITCIGLIREILGSGTFFSIQFMGPKAGTGTILDAYTNISIFVNPPGAFLVLAFMIAVINQVKKAMQNKGKDTSKFRGLEDIEKEEMPVKPEPKKVEEKTEVKKEEKPADAAEKKAEEVKEVKEES